jgi:hypothetical protein
METIGTIDDETILSSSDILWPYVETVENGIDATSIIKVEFGVKGYADDYCYFPKAVVCFKNSYYRTLNYFRMRFTPTPTTLWFDITAIPGAPEIWTDEDIENINLGLYISTYYPFMGILSTTTKLYVDAVYYKILYGV